MANSILQDEKQCYFCESQQNLHCHHIFFGANRKISEQNGFKVWLCMDCHEGTDGVHGKNGHEKDIKLKQAAQTAYEDLGHTTEQFRQLIGKSYL
jgi:Zn-finger protein